MLIALGMGAELCEGILDLIRDKPLAERVPILELIAAHRGMQEEDGHSVLPWPCPVEDLKRWIRDVLFAGDLVHDQATSRGMDR